MNRAGPAGIHPGGGPFADGPGGTMATSDAIRLSIVVPIYNEPAAAVHQTIDDLMAVRESLPLTSELIVVDDGSNGETAREIDAACRNHTELILVRNPYNLGYGASLKRGIVKARGDLILISDGDGTYPPAHIPALLEKVDGYDMVVGAREGYDAEAQRLRKPIRNVIRWLAMILTNRSIPDLNSGLRVFRKSVAEQFFHILPARFSFTSTLTLACLSNHFTIGYVPIAYHRRIGTSSIRPIQDTFQFFFLIFRIIMYFKPLRFFLLPALVLLLVGSAYLAWGVVVKEDILDGAIMLIVVGFQVLFTGFLADIITRQKMRG